MAVRRSHHLACWWQADGYGVMEADPLRITTLYVPENNGTVNT
jgi:hypothetical protein